MYINNDNASWEIKKVDILYRSSDRYRFIEKLKLNVEHYVICFDIVNFKNINNKFGFYNGDILLSEIIEHINSLSTNDLKINICRYEKDIIMVMIEPSYEIDIIEVINKIINYSYKYEICFKVGYIENYGSIDLEEFLESILYVIKMKKYIVDKTLDTSFDLSKDIEKYFAIKKDIVRKDSSNFGLVYQPKISIKDKSIKSCEILSRWNNINIGKSNPNEFIEIIKYLDKEVEFDLMIFEKVCIEVSNQRDLINRFSINVSMKSISNEKFVEAILNLVSKYNINTKSVTLEILEDICNCKSIKTPDNIDKLANLGFIISIDDFGTGHSTYCRLAELNFSEVKISREFLNFKDKSNFIKNINILKSIVTLCKSLNCKVVIEGVETRENVMLAEELDIDYIQGYYYTKPLNNIDYRRFLKEYKAI